LDFSVSSPGGLADLCQGAGQSLGRTLLWDSANHLQAVLGLVSLWRSEGHECQCHSRAEGESTADDNEKHDTYNSITNAAGAAPDSFFQGFVAACYAEQMLQWRDVPKPISRRTSRADLSNVT